MVDTLESWVERHFCKILEFDCKIGLRTVNEIDLKLMADKRDRESNCQMYLNWMIDLLFGDFRQWIVEWCMCGWIDVSSPSLCVRFRIQLLWLNQLHNQIERTSFAGRFALFHSFYAHYVWLVVRLTSVGSSSSRAHMHAAQFFFMTIDRKHFWDNCNY